MDLVSIPAKSIAVLSRRAKGIRSFPLPLFAMDDLVVQCRERNSSQISEYEGHSSLLRFPRRSLSLHRLEGFFISFNFCCVRHVKNFAFFPSYNASQVS